jgi:hypothetical protein
MAITILKVQQPEEAQPYKPGLYKVCFSKTVRWDAPPTAQMARGGPFEREVLEIEPPVDFHPGTPGHVDVRLSWDTVKELVSDTPFGLDYASTLGAYDLRQALKAAVACAK